MAICPSCGGIIGRDCFNPQECAWIAEQQEQAQQHETDERLSRLESFPHPVPAVPEERLLVLIKDLPPYKAGTIMTGSMWCNAIGRGAEDDRDFDGIDLERGSDKTWWALYPAPHPELREMDKELGTAIHYDDRRESGGKIYNVQFLLHIHYKSTIADLQRQLVAKEANIKRLKELVENTWRAACPHGKGYHCSNCEMLKDGCIWPELKRVMGFDKAALKEGKEVEG